MVFLIKKGALQWMDPLIVSMYMGAWHKSNSTYEIMKTMVVAVM
jgi:hypothetical protein